MEKNIVIGKVYVFCQGEHQFGGDTESYDMELCTVRDKVETASILNKKAREATVSHGGLYKVEFDNGQVRSVYSDELIEAVCNGCGDTLNVNGDIAIVVNEGIPGKEYVECEYCHADSLDTHKVIICEGCGQYFSLDVLHDEEFCGQSFCPCPHCGKDIVEGLTREEFEQEYGPEPSIEVQDEVVLEVNNQRQIVLEQARADGCIAVTIWEAPDKDGNRGCEAEYTISAGDFVSMLNWYRYQKEHGNENLMF